MNGKSGICMHFESIDAEIERLKFNENLRDRFPKIDQSYIKIEDVELLLSRLLEIISEPSTTKIIAEIQISHALQRVRYDMDRLKRGKNER